VPSLHGLPEWVLFQHGRAASHRRPAAARFDNRGAPGPGRVWGQRVPTQRRPRGTRAHRQRHPERAAEDDDDPGVHARAGRTLGTDEWAE